MPLESVESYSAAEHIEQAENWSRMSEKTGNHEDAMRYLARAQYHATMALVKRERGCND